MSGATRARTSPLRATVPLSCVTKGGNKDSKGATIRRTASLDAIHRRLLSRETLGNKDRGSHTDRASSLDSLQALGEAVSDAGTKITRTKRSPRDDKPAHSKNLPSPVPRNSSSVPPKSSRNSEEGLNQELELYANAETLECDRLQEPIPEGRKAPVAELIREGPFSRIYPQANQNSSEDSQGSSPDQERIISGSSPQINRFSSSAPPDGCERVLSKSVPILRPIPREVLSSHPNTSFTLKPSSHSAFETLHRGMHQPSKDSLDRDSPKVPQEEDL